MDRRRFLKVTGASLVSLALNSCSSRLPNVTESLPIVPVLNPNSSFDEIVSFLRNNRKRTIDYSVIWPRNYPVISFGEKHTIEEEFDITSHLDVYKSQGATHLMIEEKKGFQPTMDSYYRNNISDKDLLAELSNGKYPNMGGIVRMIHRAKELGIETICMDADEPEIEDLNPESPGVDFLNDLKGRNQYMAKVIGDTLQENPAARIIAHSGAAHFGYAPIYESGNEWGSTSLPVSNYLKSGGINTFRVTYAGQKKINEFEAKYISSLKNVELRDKLPRTIIDAAAKIAGIGSETFGVLLDEKVKTNNWGNYIIHLAQKDD